ncbi:hypothetical protein [Humibacillus xanthopallidus]|nr:hypothetical protein [Humibacillus xanthopallidus]
MVDDELSRAVVSFLGSPGVLEPTEPERRVAALFGDRAVALVPRIRAMLVDLDAATPPLWNTANLQEMGNNVERWVQETYPELDGHAVKAIANSYTFSYK